MIDLLLYTTEDGRSRIKLRAEQQTAWLTRLESESFVVKESLTVQTEGSRQVQSKVARYSLDVILAVGQVRKVTFDS